MLTITNETIALKRDGTMIVFENRAEYDKWTDVKANFDTLSMLFAGSQIIYESLKEGSKAEDKLNKMREIFGEEEEWKEE